MQTLISLADLLILHSSASSGKKLVLHESSSSEHIMINICLSKLQSHISSSSQEGSPFSYRPFLTILIL